MYVQIVQHGLLKLRPAQCSIRYMYRQRGKGPSGLGTHYVHVACTWEVGTQVLHVVRVHGLQGSGPRCRVKQKHTSTKGTKTDER